MYSIKVRQDKNAFRKNQAECKKDVILYKIEKAEKKKIKNKEMRK